MNGFLKGFYKHFHTDYWRYKIALFKNTLDQYEQLKPQVTAGLDFIDDEQFSKTLKIEIHFSYFQIIETLFELLFALEKKKDINLWLELTFSNWSNNYNRIKSIANGDTKFLDESVNRNFDSASLLEYIFYFLHKFSQSDEERLRNQNNIKKLLVIFAKDFSDRGEYNAYKHSLRFFHLHDKVKISKNGMKTWVTISEQDNAIIYLEQTKDKTFRRVSKGFDPDRDIELSLLCCNLIDNIIKSRRSVKKVEYLAFFQDSDIDAASKPNKPLKTYFVTIGKRNK